EGGATSSHHSGSKWGQLRLAHSDVRFTANRPHDTTVTVEHRHFERLDGGGTINDAIQGGGGWTLLLDSFTKTVADRP
ncbi:hypothetical protein ACFPFQ_19475, partial [Pseudonocardia sp. GCM10023141]